MATKKRTGVENHLMLTQHTISNEYIVIRGGLQLYFDVQGQHCQLEGYEMWELLGELLCWKGQLRLKLLLDLKDQPVTLKDQALSKLLETLGLGCSPQLLATCFVVES